MDLSAADMERFWSKVDTCGGDHRPCWLWRGAAIRDTGYGSFWAGGKTYDAHVVSYDLSYGDRPSQTDVPRWQRICVMHECDVKACCNPFHLRLGTLAENCQDRARKGRSATGDRNGSRLHPEKRPRGDAHGTRKRVLEGRTPTQLTDEQREQIYTDTRSDRLIAAEYGISKQTVSRIQRGPNPSGLPREEG